jgi:transposase
VTLVMGMDQHRAQISAEWIDTMTGEISRARVAPADRAGVRKFLAQFKGVGLEVALEATTGWRFVVEELERIGADVHLAEVVQTSGLKGRGKRAKSDWADARHLRELLLIGRLPESWIAPAHLLDLRARVRCRHTLLHQRTEWQQRMQAVLYHHGAPHARGLLKLENRERVAALKLPDSAREQLTIALWMIDAIDLQLAPFDLALRAYARKQPGCRTLMDEIYGIGELTSVTILPELGDTRRFQNSRVLTDTQDGDDRRHRGR